MILSDSHCHLDRYHNDHLNGILDQAQKAGVGLILSMSMSIEGSRKTVQMAQTYENIYAAIGIHPFMSIPPADDVKNDLRELSQQRRVVAIGEVGLDYVRKPETAEIQKELLHYVLMLARETDLPVSIHCRGAYQDVMSMVKREARQGLRGWIHSFFSNTVELKEWLDIGFYISPGFRGMVLDENIELDEAMRIVPEDRLLIETDCANMKDTDGPHEVALVAEKLAVLRSTTVEHIAAQTTANLIRLLNISDI